jgi:hypothetical protein
VDGYDKKYVRVAGCSVKHQAWQLIDHFERLLEEACPNHAYLIKHKLKDCDMMKNFMTTGSLTQDRGPEADLSGGSMTPFLGQDVVMMVYNWCPLLGGVIYVT